LRLTDEISKQLTPLEQKFVTQDGEAEGLRRFFWIWTLKEAYTKALGSGLGFGFERIEYTISEDKVTVDGVLLQGWRFSRFQLVAGADTYQGVVAESVDDDELTFADISSETWIKFQAHEFIQKAIQNLQ
jgi:4'-phosphopantetheinyl transferase